MLKVYQFVDHFQFDKPYENSRTKRRCDYRHRLHTDDRTSVVCE